MSDIVEDELLSSSVIKDPKALDFDYVPDELPHREKQLRMLAQLFKPVLAGVPQNVVITGSVGTGKTVLVKRFCLSLVKTARKRGVFLDYVHINCRRRSTDAMTLLGILNHFDPGFPDRGFSVNEMLQVLNRQLVRRETHLIVALDEVDALLRKSGSELIYNLTRFSDETSTSKKNLVSLILISQKDIFPMLDVSSLSTIKRSNHIH
ncbi:MAG TPA: AAA family ATPase, partial [Thermoplasmatales archaeon]|nr:AAA family ATPase [Thermoplasmatales archaeon]